MESFNHFPHVANALPLATSRAVRKVAFDIQADAQSLAPVDTGFLKSSIYVVTSSSSTYGQAIGASGERYLLPEVEKPEDNQTAYVAVGANYGIYLEMGTRFMPAQPYFYQAVEWGRADLDDALAQIESQLGGNLSNLSEAL
jgi:HK97 gp10 family phage protein